MKVYDIAVDVDMQDDAVRAGTERLKRFGAIILQFRRSLKTLITFFAPSAVPKVEEMRARFLILSVLSKL